MGAHTTADTNHCSNHLLVENASPPAACMLSQISVSRSHPFMAVPLSYGELCVCVCVAVCVAVPSTVCFV